MLLNSKNAWSLTFWLYFCVFRVQYFCQYPWTISACFSRFLSLQNWTFIPMRFIPMSHTPLAMGRWNFKSQFSSFFCWKWFGFCLTHKKSSFQIDVFYYKPKVRKNFLFSRELFPALNFWMISIRSRTRLHTLIAQKMLKLKPRLTTMVKLMVSMFTKLLKSVLLMEIMFRSLSKISISEIRPSKWVAKKMTIYVDMDQFLFSPVKDQLIKWSKLSNFVDQKTVQSSISRIKIISAFKVIWNFPGFKVWNTASNTP